MYDIRDGQVLQRNTLANYAARFDRAKKELLALKWIIENNVNDPKALKTQKKFAKVAALLFDIEHDFIKAK